MKLLRNISILAAVACMLTTVQALAGETLDRVRSDGVLVVGTNANWPPQSFLNDQNEMDGFDIDVAKEIAGRLGVEIKFVTPAWEIMTSGNWNGRWDITIGSMTPTKVRAKVLDFPAVYYYTPASAAVHNDSKAEKVSDLSGKVVVATTASTFELYLKNDLTIDAQDVPPFEYRIQPAEIRTVNGGGIMPHAERPVCPVAAAQNCATYSPLSVVSRGGGCTAWSSMRRFGLRLSMRG